MKQLSATAKNLQDIFRKHGVTLPISGEKLEQFAKFYKFLMDYNRKYNLTRLTTFHDVAVKHFVDCIYVAQLTPLPPEVLDVGTGAGFPGVVLKIVSPETRIILAEGVQKKVEYLKQLREHLGLKKLDIIGRNIDQKFHYPVRGVTTRAVELSAATLKNVSHCLLVGGRVMLMKTPGIDEELREAEKNMGHMYKLIQNTDYKLGPTSHQRKLVVWEKIRPATVADLPDPEED